MDKKWFARSKTFWGSLILFAPAVLQMFGVESPSELAGIGEAGAKLIDALAALAGFAWAIIGRQTATTKMSLLPNTGAK